MDTRSLVKKLGGPAELATKLSEENPPWPISAEAVQKWCERGTVPPRWYVHLVAIAQRHGVPLEFEDLYAMGQDNDTRAA